MSGQEHTADDGQNTDFGDQSRPPRGSPVLSQRGIQPQARGLPGSSREGLPPFLYPGSAQAHSRSQERSISPTTRFPTRVSSPLGQRSGFSRQSPVPQERARPFSAQVPLARTNVMNPNQASQERQPPDEANEADGLEYLMRMSRLIPTPGMVAARQMTQGLGSRTQPEGQRQQSMVIASLTGRDVVIEAMSLPADHLVASAYGGDDRVREPPPFARAGPGGTVPGTSGGLGASAARAAASPLHFWEGADGQHGVSAVFRSGVYRSGDQGSTFRQRDFGSRTPHNLIDLMDDVDTMQRYREYTRPQTDRPDVQSNTSGGMAPFVQPRLIWVEGNYELRREPHPNAEYSRKVFIGGLPLRVTTRQVEAILQAFGRTHCHKHTDRGHAYIVFESSQKVAAFLRSCCRLIEELDLYEWKTLGSKIQVIPWVTADSQYGEYAPDLGVDQLNFTVFVGALYGEVTARQLAYILETACGPVQFVRIECDRYAYPTGSARVQFTSRYAFLQAIKLHYLEIRAHHYQKTIELNPFVEEGVPCSRCRILPSALVCKALTCLKHYCNRCYSEHTIPLTLDHIPVIRREQRS